MTVRTARLFSADQVCANGLTLLFTAPAGRTLLVRELVVQTFVPSSAGVSLFIRSGPLLMPIYQEFPARTDLVTVDRGRDLVLLPGDRVEAFQSDPASHRVRVLASGSRLLGVAPA